jgi:hypothetical protein
MRSLREIAIEIASDWETINNAGAREALKHMKNIGMATDGYGPDDTGSYSVIGMFLSNAVGWKGDVSRRVKKELRDIANKTSY